MKKTDTNEFTLVNALKIQRKDLAKWQKRLNAECFCELKDWVSHQNDVLYLDAQQTGRPNNPYNVCRGNSFLDFICNFA